MLQTRAPKSECGSHRSQHVFTGLMRCAACDGAMTTESATGRTQTYHYYNCARFMKRGGCATRRMRADVFDNWLVGELVEQLFTEERIRAIMASITEGAREWATHRETERTRIVAAMRKIEAAQGRLFDVLEQGEKVEASVIAPRLKQHRATLASLERELVELEAVPEVRPLKMGLAEAAAFLKGMIYNAKSPTQVRTFMAGFIREVRVDGQKVIIDFQPEQIVNQPGLQLVHSPKSWLPDLGSNQGPAD
ncbi:MAG: zinc ribbon domain-containing protein [Betaproteobacteria bacterium]|nr:zinc ribbon domain-containing protein [Betaproteobacteria bacterium]